VVGRLSASLHLPDAAKRWLDEGAYVTFGTVDSAGRPHLNYVEVRGTATTTTDGAMELIERLARCMSDGRTARYQAPWCG
jgi:hypothetical protein